MSTAEQQRRWRAAHGARVGQGRGPAPSAVCGTVAAYKRHRRHDEAPCAACRAAWAEYQRELYQRRRAATREPNR